MNNNTMNFDVLEALKKDYDSLKTRLDKQEIINEKLLLNTFSSRMKSIHSNGWISAVAGLFVILISPLAFHYNPVMNLSWAFVAGTDIMMLVCIFFTWKFHHNVSTPSEMGDDIVSFAKKVKTLKKNYQDWTKYGFGMIGLWIIWMFTEMYFNMDDSRLFIVTASGCLFGGIIGAIIGLRMNKKVIGNCDLILKDIENI